MPSAVIFVGELLSAGHAPLTSIQPAAVARLLHFWQTQPARPSIGLPDGLRAGQASGGYVGDPPPLIKRASFLPAKLSAFLEKFGELHAAQSRLSPRERRGRTHLLFLLRRNCLPLDIKMNIYTVFRQRQLSSLKPHEKDLNHEHCRIDPA